MMWSSSSDTIDIFRQLIDELENQGFNASKYLKPPVPKTTIAQSLQSLSFKLPIEALNLYEWTDFVADVDAGCLTLLYTFSMLPFNDALSEYSDLFESGPYTPEQVDRTWYPILTNYSGDFLMVECSEVQMASGRIRCFSREDDTAPIMYSSLSNMFGTLLACYRQGAYRIFEDGYVERNPVLEISISKSINPDATFWDQ